MKEKIRRIVNKTDLKVPLYKSIKNINLELSSFCNSECAFCARQIDNDIDKYINLPFELLKKIPIEQLEFIKLEGSIGEPICYPYFHEALSYFYKKNPNIKIQIYTNGGLHDSLWWEKTAKLLSFNSKNSIVFGVNGLKDTHSIYRKNVDFNKLMKNIKTFTSFGGNAIAQMIVFKHNESQTQDVEKICKAVGCHEVLFRLSKTYDNNKLQKPIKFSMKSQTEISKEYKRDNIPVMCNLFHLRTCFITCDGYIVPCATYHPQRNYALRESEEYQNIFFSNLKKINLRNYSFKEIMENEYFNWLKKNIETNMKGCDLSCRFHPKQYFKDLKDE